MSTNRDARSAISIEETYNYKIDIGTQIVIEYIGATGEVQVTAPYDGQHLAASDGAQPVELGSLQLTMNNDQAAPFVIPLTLPGGEDRAALSKQGLEACWRSSFTPDQPDEPLLTVEGRVFDAPLFNQSRYSQALLNELFAQANTFVNDLRLSLELRVPQLSRTFRPGMRGRELRAMLLEQVSDVQIFLADLNDVELARSMAALANSGGGRILIGVQPPDKVVGLSEDRSQLEVTLLRAALGCWPPVVFSSPQFHESEDGLIVARVQVPAGRSGLHLVEGRTPFRRGGATVNESASTRSTPPTPTAIANIPSLLALGSRSDQLILDGTAAGSADLNLGPAICGLINGSARGGLLILRNLSPQSRSLLQPNLMRQIEQRITAEIAKIQPQLPPIRPEFASVDNERIAILRVWNHGTPVATYDGRAFEWTGSVLREIELTDLYKLYFERTDQAGAGQSGSPALKLVYGELGWPLQPPTVSKLSATRASDPADAVYDQQRRAMVWGSKPFYEATGKDGSICEISVSLRQAFTEINAGSYSNPLNMLQGRLHVQLDHQLVSGLNCEVVSEHPLLKGAPILKRTRILATVSVRANELFHQRRRSALLSFQLNDVSFGAEWRERINDLRQACADVGFWIKGAEMFSNESSAQSGQSTLMKGVRSSDYHDIDLIVGINLKGAELKRELHFKQYVDSKQITVGSLEALIILSGVGRGSEAEISRLQLELGRLIHQRLRYLRAE